MAFHRRDRDQLERMLRRARPEAPAALVESISTLVRKPVRRRPMLLAPARVFAIVLTLAMLGTLASFGGVSYAASELVGATRAVARVTKPHPTVKPRLTPAQLQYANPALKTSKKPKKAKKPKRRGGVKSASKVIVSGSAVSRGSTSSGVLGVSTSTGSGLPLTGFDLTLVIGGGLLLVLVGAGLRRVASDRR